MKNPIQTIEPNEQGRDFVIGDLHGSLACFHKLLEGLNFDKTKDRMFSVGDLVDRGPNSLECLELIKEPWFYCVLANHEQMMLEAFNGGYLGNFWIQNGGYWGYTAWEDAKRLKQFTTSELGKVEPHPDSMRLFELLPLVEQLPFLITVKMKDGKKFHIIHAELPPSETVTDEILSSSEKVMGLATTQAHEGGDFFLWGRHMFMPFYGQNLSANVEKLRRSIAYKFNTSFGMFNDKLSHIISGHTIMQRPITIIGQTNIDTGAYKSNDGAKPCYALTCIELNTWKFYQATPTVFRDAEPLVVNIDDVLKLRPEFAITPRSSLNDTTE